ncbi:preprotein translocase subunit SecA [bacterium]|nr:preprotein translocase subunit SecA [bacterium]
MSFLTKLFGDPNLRFLKKIQPIVDRINNLEKDFEKIPTENLVKKTEEFKKRIKNDGALDQILPEAFALVREAAKRALKQRHFDVQLIGGIVLHQGKIAEMKTGEGKTLAATLPVYLNALTGKGVHVITVNDYLAKRDTVWMGQIYHLLGLSVACITHEAAFIYDPNYQKEENKKKRDELRDKLGGFKVIKSYLRPISRKEAYLADITYGTNNEFGFDYLRDNLVQDISQIVQRELNYAIIDEVDSILIDEARTPLIISTPAEESAKLYYEIARLVKRLKENIDFNVDEKMRAVTLTSEGQNKICQWLGQDPWLNSNFTLVHHIEAALKAETLFKKDRDYIVKNGEVIIVDEFTGRLMPGRRYSEGIHQAIEAKEKVAGENVEVKQESKTLATITFQNYFRMYKKLAGMTGTAITEAEEFHKIYGLDVVVVPTNKPMIRKDLPDKIYRSEKGKYKAIVEAVKKIHRTGQPILIGTTSIEKNEILSEMFKRNGIPHRVLNAKHHEKEGEIIAQAGKLGAVTLATNMAGRGVDIILGGNPPDEEEQKKVVQLGGLFVLGTERHEARRIDNQLRGRAGRQGDPGVSQFFISLEDDIMRIFGGERIKFLMEKINLPEDFPIQNVLVSRAIEAAQKKVEGVNFDLRKHLLEYDDVLNKQRQAIYKKRRRILTMNAEQLKKFILEMISKEIENVVVGHTIGDAQEKWDIKEIFETVKTIFPVKNSLFQELKDIVNEAGNRLADAYTRDRLINYLSELARKAYDDLEKNISENEKKLGEKNLFEKIQRSILLQSIDNYWVDHLEIMENLKGGIGLRAYGQYDPLVEYKRESFIKFNELNDAINKQVVYSIYKVAIISDLTFRQNNQEIKLSGPRKTVQENKIVKLKKKPGRNDPCPCGSGKKYKNCCYPKYG